MLYLKKYGVLQNFRRKYRRYRYERVRELLKDNLNALRGGEYVCVANVHTTVTAYENEEYKKVQNGAALCIPDGKPLSVVQKKRGFKNAQRVTGPSLMEEILKISRENGYRHVFYGSTQETLDKIQARIKREYPDTEEIFFIFLPNSKKPQNRKPKKLLTK